jgi:osmoprotectant transport system ATP-binding protein
VTNAIVFDKVSKDFGTGRNAVNEVSFEVIEGHLVVLLGPSGCGKTTLLKMVNRLYEPTSGHILIDGTDIHKLKVTELRRQIGYVIQQVGLFPHMRVAKNIEVVPQMLGWEKERRSKRADELLDLVGLPPQDYRSRYPAQLSGGQQQRVGLARALAADPAIMLMDEPFAAIDNITRTRLQDELLRIQKTVRKTILFVTHDVEEALKLADEIVVLDKGQIIQYDTPLQILSHPSTDFVTQLTGAGDVLRRLSLQYAASIMQPLTAQDKINSLKVTPHTDLRTALALLVSHQADFIPVVNDADQPIGKVTLADLRAQASYPGSVPSPIANESS